MKQQRRLFEDAAPSSEFIKEAREGRRLQSTYSPIRIAIKTDLLETGVDAPYVCEPTSLPADFVFVEGSGQATSMTDFRACTDNDVMLVGDEKYNFLVNRILRDAKTFFENALSVLPVDSPLTLPNTWSDASCGLLPGSSRVLPYTCCDSILPGEAKSPGIADADFVLYVTKRPTLGSTLAWALPCQSDTRTLSRGRPTLGQANFSPARVSTDPEQYDAQLATAIHEIAHALGFTNSKFSEFINPVTGVALGRSAVLSTAFDALLGKTTTKIITTNVIETAKEHFGCTNWPAAGLELEDFGGSGTAGSHWEKRLLFNEFMTGTSDPNSVYSSMSLALFQDSGWYQVDYTRAQKLPWGLGEGCDFVQRRCGDAWSSDFFCDVSFQEGCSHDRRYRSVCNRQSHSTSLNPEFQYFSSANEGGSNPYVDYCPYFLRTSSGDCLSTETAGFWHYGEKASPGGPNSRCFAGTFAYDQVGVQQQHAACLEFSCDNPQLYIEVTLVGLGSQLTKFLCPPEGGPVDLATVADSDFVGVIECPPKETLCTGNPCDTNDCNGHGFCNGATEECECDAGYLGASVLDCSLQDCPIAASGVQCDDAARCDQTTGTCTCPAGFSGPSCEDRSCPQYLGVACGGDRGDCDSATGICDCDPEYDGNACQLIKCAGPTGALCNAPTNGVCDTSTGLCSCAETVQDVTANPIYFTGQDCGTTNLGARPSTELVFFGEGNTTATDTVTAVLPPREYTYFHFDVPSVAFEINLEVTVSGGAPVSSVSVVAAYATQGTLPSLAANQFVVEGTASGSTQTLTFEPPPDEFDSAGDSGGQFPFDSTGRMNVALVSTHSTDVTVTIKLVRDPCATLICAHGPACAAGRCQCPRYIAETFVYGWAGERCDQPDCPGTPDCKGRGLCVIENIGGLDTPICSCNEPYSGTACQDLDISGVDAGSLIVFGDNATASTEEYDFVSSSYSGRTVVGSVTAQGSAVPAGSPANVITEIDIAGNYTVAIRLDRSVSVYVRLESHSPNADPLLLLGRDSPPTPGSYQYFDVSSWTAKAATHQIGAIITKGSTLDELNLFIRVVNSRYATSALNATLYYEVAEVCPPSLTFSANVTSTHLPPSVATEACSGHGLETATCSNPSLVSASAPALCECDLGWEGVLCETEVPALVNNAVQHVPAVSAPALQPGEWKYFVFEAPSSLVELVVELNQTTTSTRTQMLLMVGSLPSRRAQDRGLSSTLDIIQDDALFDFDGFTSNAKRQVVRISRDGNHADTRYYYVGVHNTPNARANLRTKLTLRAESRFEHLCTTPECFADASMTLCHGRGTAVPGLENDPAGDVVQCVCPTWKASSYCGAPNLLGTVQKLLGATQEIEFLCNVCGWNANLTKGDVAFFSTPQPLQKSTALSVRTLDVANASDTALMVAPYLPRSIADFTFVSSTDSLAEVLTLDESSPTGNYWVGVYADSPGIVNLQAERQSTDADGGDDQQFIKELGKWLEGTSVGNVVLVFSVLFILCVCMGCCCQHLECRNCKPQRRQTETKLGFAFGSSRNLGLFSPATRGLKHGPAADPLTRMASGRNLRAGQRDVEMAPRPTIASNRNPMHNQQQQQQQQHMMPQHHHQHHPQPYHGGGFAPPTMPPPAHLVAAHAGTPPPTHLVATMPDGSALPPPPSSSAPLSLSRRLRTASIHAGQRNSPVNVLAPPKAVPPPPSI